MNLADLMDEIGDALDTITGLRVYRWPAAEITPPAAIVTYPERIEFDGTYRRGMDRVTIPVIVVAGRASERAARDNLARYCDGSGATSVKAAVDGHTYTVADSVRVTQIEFDVFTMNGADYVSATFDIDVVGLGE
jgi:hypothetical protein